MSQYTCPAQISSGIPFVVDEANPTHALGERIVTPDGRSFRYVKAGASALVAGNLLQGRAEDTGEQSILMAAAAVGATTVTTADTVTVTANQYAGGWIVGTAEGGTGNAIAYKIKSHPAATAATLTITLEDPLQVAFSAATQVDFVPNLYDGVVAHATTPTSAKVGVAVNDISANQYGWVQTGGIGVVLNDAAGAITVGTDIMGSTSVAGAIRAHTGTAPRVGTAMTGIAASENGLVKLFID